LKLDIFDFLDFESLKNRILDIKMSKDQKRQGQGGQVRLASRNPKKYDY